MTMDSHNTETEKVVSEESIEIEKLDDADVQVLNWDRVQPENLSIAEEPNTGGDPYNSTGQFVIIKSKLNLDD